MHPSNVNHSVGELATHLIIVCCHAIWLGGTTNEQIESDWYVDPQDFSSRYTFFSISSTLANSAELVHSFRHHLSKFGRVIEHFQRGETPTFREHIKAGLRALMERPSSLLVFSGCLAYRSLVLEN